MPDVREDPRIEALIEEEATRALGPYRALGLPAEVLDEMGHVLRLGLRTHPTAQALLRRIRAEMDDGTQFPPPSCR